MANYAEAVVARLVYRKLFTNATIIHNSMQFYICNLPKVTSADDEHGYRTPQRSRLSPDVLLVCMADPMSSCSLALDINTEDIRFPQMCVV